MNYKLLFILLIGLFITSCDYSPISVKQPITTEQDVPIISSYNQMHLSNEFSHVDLATIIDYIDNKMILDFNNSHVYDVKEFGYWGMVAYNSDGRTKKLLNINSGQLRQITRTDCINTMRALFESGLPSNTEDLNVEVFFSMIYK